MSELGSLSFVTSEKGKEREPQEGGDGGRTGPGGESENGGGERRRRNRTGRGGRERRGGESLDRGGDRSPERFNGEEGREGTKTNEDSDKRQGARAAPRTPHDPAGPTGDGANKRKKWVPGGNILSSEKA